MSINICKECGKQFEADSPRVAYCSDIHYRPCPVCGKPVVAKYLSDPARRCDECKGKGKIAPRSRSKEIAKKALGFASPASTEEQPTPTAANAGPDYIDGPGVFTRRYVGTKSCGLIPNHTYTFEVRSFDLYGYNLRIMMDHTSEEELDLSFPCASRISINHVFVPETNK